MGDKQDTFLLTDQLARAVLGRHKKPTEDEVVKLTFSLVNGVLNTEDYARRRWPGVKIPADLDVRELIVGRDGWRSGRVPESIVAVGMNLAEEDLLDPLNHAMGPMRWLGIFHLVHGCLKALDGDLDGQSFADGWETVGDLLGLLKPAMTMLSPVQIAVMAMAHDFEGMAQPWEHWLNEVNDLLEDWQQPTVSKDTLRSEVAVLRKKGFAVDDDGLDLRIPTTMVVVSVKRIKAVTNTLLGK